MNLCTPSDVYAHGLPRGSIPGTGRVVESVSLDGDDPGAILRLRAHGFALDTPVRVRAEAGGVLPDPLARDVTYYAIPLHEDAFRLAESASTDGVPAAALDFAGRGCGIVVIPPDPIAAAIDFGSRIVLDMLPAHVLPLETVPDIVRITAAELAAHNVLSTTGGAAESLTTLIDQAQARMTRWAKGVPLRENPPPAAGKAITSSAVAPAADSGWTCYGGIR